jgi:hypothetical protein
MSFDEAPSMGHFSSSWSARIKPPATVVSAARFFGGSTEDAASNASPKRPSPSFTGVRGVSPAREATTSTSESPSSFATLALLDFVSFLLDAAAPSLY